MCLILAFSGVFTILQRFWPAKYLLEGELLSPTCLTAGIFSILSLPELFIWHCRWETSRFKIHRLRYGELLQGSQKNSLVWGGWGTAQKQLETTELCFYFVFYFFFPQIVSVLTGKFESFIKECVIIDCRYPYEYEGGHIKVCWPYKSSAGGLELQIPDFCPRPSLWMCYSWGDPVLLPGFGNWAQMWVMKWLFPQKKGHCALCQQRRGLWLSGFSLSSILMSQEAKIGMLNFISMTDLKETNKCVKYNWEQVTQTFCGVRATSSA